MYDVVILGAGFAGVYTALELAKTHPTYNILLLDAGPEIISSKSSSYNECYKLHTGAHYLGHFETAKRCLISSIEFAKESSDYILGSPGEPWRKGRHYLMSNSLFSVEAAKTVCEGLAETYRNLVKADPANKVFGEPEEFIRYLEPEEYSYVADSIPFTEPDSSKDDIKVMLGIETPESQIDINKMKEDLQSRINECKTIEFLPDHKVKSISWLQDELGYSVQTKSSNDSKQESTELYTAKLIVNCTWESIERLNKQLGLYIPDGKIIRIKASILVDLPKNLHNANTCIFSVGPYCSFTNQGNGTAILTAEQVTNVGYYSAGIDINDFTVTEDNVPVKKFMEGLDIAEGKGKDLSEKILQGCVHYIPSLQDAKIREIRVGYVKIIDPERTYSGSNSLHDPESSIHSRQNSGVGQEQDLCFLSNSGMKMTYTKRNAQEICRLIERNLNVREGLMLFISSMKEQIVTGDEKFTSFLLHHTFREYLLEKLTLYSSQPTVDFIAKTINKLVGQKKDVVAQVSEVVEKIHQAGGIRKFFESSSWQRESSSNGNSGVAAQKRQPDPLTVPRSMSSPALAISSSHAFFSKNNLGTVACLSPSVDGQFLCVMSK